jgi:AraC-like DNA-binding protein
MTHLAERRRVDWRAIIEGNLPRAKLVRPTERASQFAALVSQAMESRSPEAADRLVRDAVEFSKTTLRLERSAIFLVDTENCAMVGTWGTNAARETVDEHALTYDLGALDREIFERARAGFHWTAYENCPLIAQSEGGTRILGRGWVACTAIAGPRGPLGILFNDTALSRAPIDETKQVHAAILCGLLGQALDLCRPHLTRMAPAASEPAHPLVRGVTRLLLRDPTLSCNALAEQLHVNAGWLARIFKREAGTSVVDHRNELRLARFLDRVDARAHSLLEAALDAGFGSYAQFHRVFRARFGRTPREYVVERRQAPVPRNGTR